MPIVVFQIGYSKVYLVGTGNDNEFSNIRIYYCNPGNATPSSIKGKGYEEALMGDITFDSWSILPQCDLILITSNNCDMNVCVEQLAKVLGIHACLSVYRLYTMVYLLHASRK